MIKALIVFGTRPEAIKLAPLVKELERYPQKFKSVGAVTAQHREMLDQVLSLFNVTPKYDLNIMRSSQDLFSITTKALNGLKKILKREKPDVVLVQGDTTTTFAAALAAFYHKIPLGHVEAGLRTFNKYQPFPEEVNRCLTSSIATFHFAPTHRSKQNLLKEGVPEKSIFVTGNTGIDALFMTLNSPNRFYHHPVLSKIASFKRIIVVTAHRRENWGIPIENICQAIHQILDGASQIGVVFSVHLNPKVQTTVHDILGENKRVFLVNPLSYENFVELMNRCYLILTDSGGIQEEAPSLGKPVLVLRNVTERPEAVEAGAAKVVGTDPSAIAEAAIFLSTNEAAYQKMACAKNPYGDGHAAMRIVKILDEHLNG